VRKLRVRSRSYRPAREGHDPGESPAAVDARRQAWGDFVRDHLAPLGLTEKTVFAIIGRGKLGDPVKGSSVTTEMKKSWELSHKLGLPVKPGRRLAPYEHLQKPHPILVGYPPFNDRIVQLYDVVAARIPASRQRLKMTEAGPVPKPADYNQRAMELTADILYVLGCAQGSGIVKSIKSMIQKRLIKRPL
jgi:hypothetical protein